MSSNMWILHAFSQIYFIFQGSQENHSKTLNNLKIYFQLLHLKNQLSGIIHGYIFYFAINFNKENCLLIIGTPRQNTYRFWQLVLIIQIFNAF